MNKYKESPHLLKIAQWFQEFENERNLLEIEDLEVYIHTIKNRFYQKKGFPIDFVEGYEILRGRAEVDLQKSKKYSREKYFLEDED